MVDFWHWHIATFIITEIGSNDDDDSDDDDDDSLDREVVTDN